MKLLQSLLSLFLLFTASTALAADAVPSPLRIGTSASYAPLTFQENGEFKGIEADLARAVGENLKVKTRIVILPWEQLIPALLDGRIDVIMSGMSVTPARSKKVLFTEPYMKVGQMALIRTADLVRWSRPAALYRKGTRVGVKAGTTGESWARANLPDATITAFDTVQEGTRALEKGRIDIFIHDAPTIWRLTANTATQKAGLMGLYRPLTEEHLAWAVRPDDKALASALNHTLEQLKQNGTLGRIQTRWIPVQVKVK